MIGKHYGMWAVVAICVLSLHSGAAKAARWHDAVELIDEQNVEEVATHLGTYFNRYFNTSTGVAAAQWLHERASQLADGSDGSCELFAHKNMPQPSVVCTLPASVDSDEAVVVGAHLDSAAFRNPETLESEYPVECVGKQLGTCSHFDFGTREAPGVDDNASGCAALMETWRILTALDRDSDDSFHRRERSLVLCFYSSEEWGVTEDGVTQGFAGSTDVSGALVDRYNVVAMLNYDSISTSFDPLVALPNVINATANSMGVIRPDTSQASDALRESTDALGYFVVDLIDTYTRGYTGQLGPVGLGASDFIAFSQRGVPAVGGVGSGIVQADVFWQHSTLDTAANFNASYVAEFARVSTAFALETIAPSSSSTLCSSFALILVLSFSLALI
jgi:bacterial leucyl aminopeptidase